MCGPCGSSVLFLNLAIGYVLCILAEKQKNLLKTAGYTLGIAIIALSLIYGVLESAAKPGMMGKMMCGGKGMKHGGANFMKGHHK